MSDSESDARRRALYSMPTDTTPSADLKKEVVTELKGFFDSKFAELKRDFREDSEWTAESVRKKVRSDNLLTFKNFSNRKQYQFNAEISDLLDSSRKAIDLRNATKATEYIEEAKSKIKHRNKLIRIADSSPAGWLTIQEYEQNEVASDSDDDKKIRRAEERAKAKLEKSKKSDAWNSGISANGPSGNQSFRSFRKSFPRSNMAGQPRPPANIEIICYACGGLGHFASGCAAHVQFSNTSRAMGSENSEGSTISTTDQPITITRPEQTDK